MRHQASPEDTRPRHVGSACLGWEGPALGLQGTQLASGGRRERGQEILGKREEETSASPSSPTGLSPKAHKILQNTSSILISEGQELQLLCVADSNPPAQLSWFRGSPALEATPISSTGVLELPCVGAAEEGEFTCRAQNPLGSQNISLSLSVVCECGVPWGQEAGVPGRGEAPLIPPISPTAPPQLLGPSCSQEDEGLRCSCSSQARPAPSLRWRLGKGLLEGNFSNASFEISSSSAGPWANGSLSLREGLSSGLSLSCEALNVHGAQSGSVLLLPGQGSAEG